MRLFVRTKAIKEGKHSPVSRCYSQTRYWPGTRNDFSCLLKDQMSLLFGLAKRKLRTKLAVWQKWLHGLHSLNIYVLDSLPLCIFQGFAYSLFLFFFFSFGINPYQFISNFLKKEDLNSVCVYAHMLVGVLEMSSNEGWATNTTTSSLLRKSEQENPSQGSRGMVLDTRTPDLCSQAMSSCKPITILLEWEKGVRRKRLSGARQWGPLMKSGGDEKWISL